MEILKSFKIDVSGTIEEPLFRASQVADVIGLKNVSSVIQKYHSSMKIKKYVDTRCGRRQATFLTVMGLCKMIFSCRNEKANELQDLMCEIIKQIRINGIYGNSQYLHQEQETRTHKMLLSVFHLAKVMYVCMLNNYKDFENTGKNVYRIAHSNNLQKTVRKLENLYGPVTLLKAYVCDSEIEDVLYESDAGEYICETNFINPDAKEIFLLSQDELHKVLDCLQSIITRFQEPESNHRDKENHSEEVPEYEWKEGDTLFDTVPIKNTKSPWIQKYDPTTFELVETFDSIIDLTRKDLNITYYGLKSAVKANTIYKGFRWLFVDKSQANIKYDLEPTECIPYTQPNQLIAMLDISKTHIIEVYPSQKHAALSRNFNSFAPITQALKKGTLSGGHYWKRYDECSDELKATYAKPLPDKVQKNNCAKQVHLIHKTTKEIVKTFDTVTDVLTSFQMSRRKLNLICASKEVYKNWIFEFAQ
jgi:prophage antirepressor-like protein/DNA-directed RNA polymerase subunit H (RpoH/RPB5)